MDMNVVTVIGRVTSDIAAKETVNGNTVVNFTIAIKDYLGNGMPFECVAWGNTGRYIRTFTKKGDAVAINGGLTEIWKEDEKGSPTGRVPGIRVNEIYSIGGKRNGEQKND